MKTILVVDDEPDVRETVKLILERKGYKVHTAIDGDDCIEKLHEFTPDLILLDIMMPGTPVKNIIDKIQKTKIAFLTVVRTTEAEKQDLFNNKNVVDFIQKPFDVNDLINRIEGHVNV